MLSDRRRVAVALAGFCVFLNLYAPQSVLPLLAGEFAVGAGQASLAITASTLAVALMAPFAGTFADVVGRRRVIVAAMFALVVPTIMVALAPGIHALVFWRFVQGLALPPIFAVMVAYIAEEWPAGEAIGVTGLYTSAASFGGFFGRLITGILADWAGWRIAFLALAALTL
ncbi:MAG: MFS transporter, partial [Alphaproteobacteria bacterium]